ncbi:MAG: ATP-binding protein [Bacteroidia bacterium]|nr:ATP-binding protein [Bacteroidia bacterium]
MVPRRLAAKASELLEKYPLIVISGPRQSGKTTLARQLRPDFTYVNLELAENRNFAEQDPHQFLQKYQGGVILDEVQYVPSLFPYLKHYTDQRGAAGEYILTGSQHFLMLEKITQSLAGRAGLLHLLPFSNEELSSAGFLPPDAETLIWKGAYPRLYDKDIQPADFYPAYTGTYVERDVRQLINVRNLKQFRQFLTACAGRTGQLLNFSELGGMLGLDSKTVKAWMGILEASFIVYLLPPYHRNFDKRIVKMPKLYFYDTGLACSLLSIRSAEQLDQHFAKGALFENMVITELLKAALNRGEQPSFYFWRDSNQRELDLLIENGPLLKGIEIKASRTFHPDFAKNLLYFKGLDAQLQTELYVVYGGDADQRREHFSLLSWERLGLIG